MPRIVLTAILCDSRYNFLIIYGEEDSKPRWMWFLGGAHGTRSPTFEVTIKMSFDKHLKKNGGRVPSWNDFSGFHGRVCSSHVSRADRYD